MTDPFKSLEEGAKNAVQTQLKQDVAEVKANRKWLIIGGAAMLVLIILFAWAWHHL